MKKRRVRKRDVEFEKKKQNFAIFIAVLVLFFSLIYVNDIEQENKMWDDVIGLYSTYGGAEEFGVEVSLNVGESMTVDVAGGSYGVGLNGISISGDSLPVASIIVNGVSKTIKEESLSKEIGGLNVFAKTVFRTGDNEGYVILALSKDIDKCNDLSNEIKQDIINLQEDPDYGVYYDVVLREGATFTDEDYLVFGQGDLYYLFEADIDIANGAGNRGTAEFHDTLGLGLTYGIMDSSYLDEDDESDTFFFNGKTYVITVVDASENKVKLTWGSEGEVYVFEGCQPDPVCFDSDGGENYFVNGTTAGKSIKRSDFCTLTGAENLGSSPILKEHYCLGGNVQGTAFECPNGCVNGACLPEGSTEPGVCEDTDGGANKYVKGNTMYTSSFYADLKIDYCEGSIVYEYRCVNNLVSSADPMVCANGCSDGACVGSGCTENWQCNNWGSCINNKELRVCTDLNSCGTTINKPVEIKSCGVECTENWICTPWADCFNGKSTRLCSDMNRCGTENNYPGDFMSCEVPNPNDKNVTPSPDPKPIHPYVKKFYIRWKEVSVEITEIAGKTIVVINNKSVESYLDVLAAAPRIYAEPSAGWKNEIGVLPALSDLTEVYDEIIIDDLNKIRIKEHHGQVVYEIEGIKKARFLLIISVKAKVIQKVNI